MIRLMERDPYRIKKWSDGYFGVNDKGHVVVKPDGKTSGDLYELVKTLVTQGIEPPILIRFNGIIKSRIKLIHDAFDTAIKEAKYSKTHLMAFPIKVNPQRHVVEAVVEAGQSYETGLEVGSKPELIAVLTLENHLNSILLLNGYKDAEYITLALMAQKLGKRALIIIEQFSELELVLDIADKLKVEAEIGFRMKLSSKGTGRWQSSGGEHAKFGLFTYEIVEGLKILEKRKKKDWLKLLHFHIGSQLTTIESIKSALNEASRMYVELAKQAPSLTYFDVGGGLAVDYDGSKSKTESSMNYSLLEYARNVVDIVQETCKYAKVKEPTLITESGRAIVAHHSVLIIEVIDSTTSLPSNKITGDHPYILALNDMIKGVDIENAREIYHDALEIKNDVVNEFVEGTLNIEERGSIEKLYRELMVKIHPLFVQMNEVSDELESLNNFLLETYFCNFSLFQSLPDSWAIDQLFPVMPIHHLDKEADHRAILADLSCDSDGKINKFIDKKDYILLQPYKNEPYYLGIFLVGAYQEILGGLHNLFGDTNVVYADLEKGEWKLSKLVEGDTIEEVLHYVQYNTEKLMEQLQTLIEKSIKASRLTPEESVAVKKQFKQALESYTYLVI
jgi:arginine decarboxylase